MVKRRKALFFYRSMHLLWHEVSGGGILMIFVHKPDVFFVYLALLSTCRVLHGSVESLHFSSQFWEVIYFNSEGPASNPVGTGTDLDAKEMIQKLKTRDIRRVSVLIFPIFQKSETGGRLLAGCWPVWPCTAV